MAADNKYLTELSLVLGKNVLFIFSSDCVLQEDVEISITDSASLDRLSLHSQEDGAGDEIDIEKYLRSAGRAAGWSKDFDALLSDKIGLSKFTEFLQKEFSHENIYFWSACERYRLVGSGAARLRLAEDILQVITPSLSQIKTHLVLPAILVKAEQSSSHKIIRSTNLFLRFAAPSGAGSDGAGEC